jgi:eukaryotic-like serine/threonine-protein kinase
MAAPDGRNPDRSAIIGRATGMPLQNLPGTFDPYELRDVLGRGGGGEVYRAWDPRLRREVALKVLRDRAGAEADPSRVERFIAEARAASALNHPNIVTVFDAAIDHSKPYIVSELVDGRTLREEISRGPIAIRRALDLAAQIADGLAAAHHAGLVHRDLKPENVMVTRTGRAKIIAGWFRQGVPARQERVAGSG